MKQRKESIKNPLSLALGRAIAKHRTSNAMSIQEAARAIGVGIPYYRHLESGINNFHPSKAPSIVSGFNGKLSLRNLGTLLIAISFTESYTSKRLQDNKVSDTDNDKEYLLGIKAAVKELCSLDKNLRALFLPFFEEELFKVGKSTSELIKEINSLNIDSSFYEFISVNRDREIKPSHELPSIYSAVIEVLKSLPVSFNYDKSAEWERVNTKELTELVTIMDKVDIIISPSALNGNQYDYPYLFEPTFTKGAKLMYKTGEGEDSVKEAFSTQFNRIWKDKRSQTEIDDALRLINFVKIKGEVYAAVMGNLKEHLHDRLDNFNNQNRQSKENLEINSIWIFSKKDKSKVGIIADTNLIESNNEPILKTEFLSIKETETFYELILETWNNLALN
jgi:transcriptional regulator with XRE-family HTH domain